MIGKILQEILNEKGIKVSELSRLINVSDQTLYSIIKRDNMKIDFEILLKICSALNVDIERFYCDYVEERGNNKKIFDLTDEEIEIIKQYRNKPELRHAVGVLLGVSNSTEPRPLDEVSKDISRELSQITGAIAKNTASK